MSVIPLVHVVDALFKVIWFLGLFVYTIPLPGSPDAPITAYCDKFNVEFLFDTVGRYLTLPFNSLI